MKTLREIIIENVGDDVADNRYFEELGYHPDNLEEIPDHLGKINGADVWKLSTGFHISTDTAEFYAEDITCRHGDVRAAEK